jgi:hypothetical protein
MTFFDFFAEVLIRENAQKTWLFLWHFSIDKNVAYMI